MQTLRKIFTTTVTTAGFVLTFLAAMYIWGLTNDMYVNAATVVVTDRESFEAALQSAADCIEVSGDVTVGADTTTSGKMKPLVIPGGTTVTVAQSGGTIDFRCPLQLGGDGVVFKDITMQFSSSDALGSVPHKEIFLAGYSLTLDNVHTYLEGSAGSLGGFGGSEDELLPTVYAGAFEGTEAVGTNASLTVLNSNDDTMFEGIYMSHDSGDDSKVAYTGAATLTMDDGALVRGGVYTDKNTVSSAVNISADSIGQVGKAASFYGNANTILTFEKVKVSGAIIDGVKELVLDNGASVELEEACPALYNVTVKNSAILDCRSMLDMVITGDFAGGVYDSANDVDTTGSVILNVDGILTIEGTVSGNTVFDLAGYMSEGTYIIAGQTDEDDFILSEEDFVNGFYLYYEDGAWSVYNEFGVTVYDVEVKSFPAGIDINSMPVYGDEPSEDAPFCEVVWKDVNGKAIGSEDIIYTYMFYYDVIIIKSEYWDSDDESVLDIEDFSIPVLFVASEQYPDKYFLQAFSEESVIPAGKYKLLFSTESVENLATVADAKSYADYIAAEIEIEFYDSSNHEHSYTNGKCVCGEYADGMSAVVGHSLTLDGNIGVNFFIEMSDDIGEDAYIEFTLSDETILTVPVSSAGVEVQNGISCRRFTCEVAAKEMTGNITAQLIDGERQGTVFSYSVKQYADIITNDDSDKYVAAKALVQAMLNYGAYAQQYFGHNTTDMAADLTDVSAVTAETLKSFAKDTYSNDSVSLKVANLTLESETTLTLGFTLGTDVSVDNLTFRMGEEVVQPIDKGGYVCVVIDGIAADNLDNDYVVTVDDGKDVLTVTYNPMTYCYNVLKSDNSDKVTDDLKNVVRALYLYNQAANAYLDK